MEPPIRELPPEPSAPPPPLLDGKLHLFGNLADDIAGYRRREAAWVSITAHGAAVLILIFMPKWIPKPPVTVPVNPKNTIFVDSSDSTIKVKSPKTNIVSDADRIAQSPVPLPDRRLMKQLLDARRAGL